jgi:hypothetical protein
MVAYSSLGMLAPQALSVPVTSLRLDLGVVALRKLDGLLQSFWSLMAR